MAHAAASTDRARPRGERTSTVRSLDDLARLTASQAEALYRDAGMPERMDQLDGDLVGRMLALRGTGGVVLGALASFARSSGFPWAGKSFSSRDATTGSGINRVRLGGRHRLFPFRTRFGGYYLTGDLMYRDGEGFYYHVDRAVDAVDLGGGNWLYTALAEERILASCAQVRDCTVVAGHRDGAVVTDLLLMLEPGADDDADHGAARDAMIREALGGPVAATLRQITVADEDDIVVGPTGKVRKFLMRQRHLAATQA